jgi:hypothetical protein
MTHDEFFYIGRVAFITGNVQEALDAKKTLEKVLENSNNLQQLKTKIAGLIADIGEPNGNTRHGIDIRQIIERLRKLSVV